MTKWQISRQVNPKQSTIPWSKLAPLAVCFAFIGLAAAQLAEGIDPVTRSVLMPAMATSASPQSTSLCGATHCNNSKDILDSLSLQHLAGDVSDKDLSWGGDCDDFIQGGGSLPDTSVGVPAANPEPSGRLLVVSVTIARKFADASYTYQDVKDQVLGDAPLRGKR